MPSSTDSDFLHFAKRQNRFSALKNKKKLSKKTENWNQGREVLLENGLRKIREENPVGFRRGEKRGESWIFVQGEKLAPWCAEAGSLLWVSDLPKFTKLAFLKFINK